MLLRIANILLKNGYSVSYLSFRDGYYKETITKLNIPLKIIEEDFNNLQSDLDDFFNEFDLIICNTVVTCKIVSRFNNTRPIIWYIRENLSIKGFAKVIYDLETTLKRTKNIYTVSELCKSHIETKYHTNNIKVIHNYHEVDEKYDNNKKNENNTINLLYIGSIDSRKGLDILLDANKRLEIRKRIKINYAGAILDEDYYRNVILKYKEENITYLGIIKNEQKKKAIEEADFFVVPSRDEPASLVVIEAFCIGKPVIISNMVGCKYMVNKKNGFIFDLNDINSLTKILEKIENKKININRLKENALLNYKKYVNKEEYEKNIINMVESHKNKSNVSLFSRCIGCGLCKQICKNNAIDFVKDEEGFRVPYVNEKKCIYCNKCTNNCPVINYKKSENKHLYNYEELSEDSYKDTVLNLIKDTENVIGIKFNKNKKLEYEKIERKDYSLILTEEICDINQNKLYKLIKKFNDSEEITVICRPCQIEALKKVFSNKKIRYIPTKCEGAYNEEIYNDIYNVDENLYKNAAKINLFTRKYCMECDFISNKDENKYRAYARKNKYNQRRKLLGNIKATNEVIESKADLIYDFPKKRLSYIDVLKIYGFNKYLEKKGITSLFVDYKRPDDNDIIDKNVNEIYYYLLGTYQITEKWRLEAVNNASKFFFTFDGKYDDFTTSQKDYNTWSFLQCGKKVITKEINDLPIMLLLDKDILEELAGESRDIQADYTVIYTEVIKDVKIKTDDIVITINNDDGRVLDRVANIIFYAKTIITDNPDLAILSASLNKNTQFVRYEKQNIEKLEAINKRLKNKIQIVTKINYYSIINRNVLANKIGQNSGVIYKIRKETFEEIKKITEKKLGFRGALKTIKRKITNE